MSETVTYPGRVIDIADGAPSAMSPTAAPAIDPAGAGSASAAAHVAPSAMAPESQVLLELIGRGLAPDADDAARAAARELWAHFAQVIAAAMPAASTAPAPPPAELLASAPALVAPRAQLPPMLPPSPPPPASPIAAAAQTLRQMSPDQILELALQRLRAALPAGATIPAPRGIQFQLVPIPPPSR